MKTPQEIKEYICAHLEAALEYSTIHPPPLWDNAENMELILDTFNAGMNTGKIDALRLALRFMREESDDAEM